MARSGCAALEWHRWALGDIENRSKEAQRVGRSGYQGGEPRSPFSFRCDRAPFAGERSCQVVRVLSVESPAWRTGLEMSDFWDGGVEKKLHQQTHQLGLEQRVIWMGYRRCVGDELAGLDLLLSFSKRRACRLTDRGRLGRNAPCVQPWEEYRN